MPDLKDRLTTAIRTYADALGIATLRPALVRRALGTPGTKFQMPTPLFGVVDQGRAWTNTPNDLEAYLTALRDILGGTRLAWAQIATNAVATPPAVQVGSGIASAVKNTGTQVLTVTFSEARADGRYVVHAQLPDYSATMWQAEVTNRTGASFDVRFRDPLAAGAAITIADRVVAVLVASAH